jgi:thiol-disulfide isomerase/thioredoxin
VAERAPVARETPGARDPFALEADAERMRAELERLRNLRFVGMDEGPVPAFDVVTVSGTEFDSSELVGQEPFIVAFFATWCDACETKLRSLQRALTKSGSMLVIPVSVDGTETHDRVEPYLRAVGMGAPPVFASDYPLFTLSYNPFNTVPLLVIVGKNGGLVDYQLGYELEHERRLLDSLRLARVIGPLAKSDATTPTTTSQ